MNGSPGTPISKIEAAARQLDTAIDLYFDDTDSLSVYTLAYASFKLLFDIYPHRRNDDFATQMEEIITFEGWKSISGLANFLKHADRDPNAYLEEHHPEQGMSLIGLATLLYRRIAGEFTPKMRAFDYWMEETAYEELGIEEIDENPERAAEYRRRRDAVRMMPHSQKIAFARKQYYLFLQNFERLSALVEKGQAAGLSATKMLDKYIHRDEGNTD